MDESLSIEVTALTHRGYVRRNNEDSITVAGWVSDEAMAGLRRSRHQLAGVVLCAVADGMGGHAAGEIASRYTAKRLASTQLPAAEAGAVTELLTAINAELYRAMAADRALRGMGTTIAGLMFSPDRVLWFNIGDSRVYRQREGALQQLSVDHVPPGGRTGILTQTIGGSLAFVPIDPQIDMAELTVPSRWLICSDGLTDMVGDAEIARCMAANDEQAATAMFQAAMTAGGADNISIILASVYRSSDLPDPSATNAG